MITFAWSEKCVEDKIAGLAKKKDRKKAKKALKYLLNNEASAYKSFYDNHKKFLRKEGDEADEDDEDDDLLRISENMIIFGQGPHADVRMIAPGTAALCAAMVAARRTTMLLQDCFVTRLAVCCHTAMVVAILYLVARPMRPLDLYVNALVADALLLSVDPPTALRRNIMQRFVQSSQLSCKPKKNITAWLTSSFIYGLLETLLTIGLHATPLLEGGGDAKGEYRSAALALQMPVSAALLPLAIDDTVTMRAPIPLGATILASVAWGLFRITWTDVALVWAWSVLGHIGIFAFARRAMV